MRKNDKGKLSLFLVGINARLRENKDYFVCIDMVFRSGTKTFEARFLENENSYSLTYKGENREISSIADFFVEEAMLYEEATLIYKERGATITISCTDRAVTMKQSEEENAPIDTSFSKREYIINPTKAQKLLKAINIMTNDGKIKNDMIRKYSQIDHYVELVAPMFDSCDDKEILLLDCACGKSYLSFVMNYYLRDVLKRKCKIIGIDISENVIEKSQKLAKELGYSNMEFVCCDLNSYVAPDNVTAVISLHACDIATDLSLGTAIKAKAKYIACVPCCHKELLDKFKIEPLNPLLSQGIFKARFNDVITDSLRALRLEASGYKVSCLEYISPLDTPKNILIRAEKVGEINEKATMEYKKVTSFLNTFSTLDRLLLEDEIGEYSW